MISVLVRLRIDSWDQFRAVHDDPEFTRIRLDTGNLSHQVLSQLDDPTDVVFWDTWSSPQDADDFYEGDRFVDSLGQMGASIVERINLEQTPASSISPH